MNSRAMLLGTIALTYLALMVISGFNVLDPFLRHDDYPALLAAPSSYYKKTLSEGRWLNYWWHLRGIVTPSWLNFAAYQLFWAAFCAATAVLAGGRNAPRLYVALLSLMIALGVPSLLISGWFNTLLPGIGIVALYALLATQLSLRTMRLLLLIFVPITLTAYTTYPFLLLSVCIVAEGQDRSWKDLLSLLAIFVISFALGILVIYILNLMNHGVFGVQLADWRSPNPAHDLVSVLANAKTAAESLRNAATVAAFELFPMMLLNAVLFATAIWSLSKLDPWSVLYILCGMVLGLGFLCLQVVVSGVYVPPRVTSFVWLLYAVATFRALILLRSHQSKAERWLLLALLTNLFIYRSHLRFSLRSLA